MRCSKYSDRPAAGMCVFSGKPYCAEELVELYGKLIAKDNVEKFIEERHKTEISSKSNSPAAAAPMVFMNAGGGGGGSSASSSSSSGGWLYRRHSLFFHLVMTFLTGGLWLVWLIIRGLFY